MCTSKITSVRSISCRGVNCVAIPCGVCATCRKNEQLEWSFRIKTELLALNRDEWYCVFFTMTYSEKHLPHIPRILLNKEGIEEYKNKETPPCFSKQDIREFHESLRHWLARRGCKDEKRYKYMTCAEYGEHTQRCHYHTLLCVPKFIDPHELFDEVRELWCGKRGYIFPKKFNGGIDKYGYNHKPFVVESIEKAAGYCSKYISKDLAFQESFNHDHFKRLVVLQTTDKFVRKEYKLHDLESSKLVLNENQCKDEKIRLSDYLCFHLQSRSLGLSFAEKLTAREKLSFIKNGYFFNGDDFCNHVPKYMLNKFLYTNYYIIVDDKRKVRRMPTEFFNEHYDEIFEKKTLLMKNKIEDFEKNYEPYFRNHFERDIVDSYDNLKVYFCEQSNYDLAGDFVAYVGVSPAAIEPYKRKCDYWFQRFCYISKVENLQENVYEECVYGENLKVRYYENLNKLYFLMAYIKAKIDEVPRQLQLENERNIAWVSDAFKSYEDVVYDDAS